MQYIVYKYMDTYVHKIQRVYTQLFTVVRNKLTSENQLKGKAKQSPTQHNGLNIFSSCIYFFLISGKSAIHPNSSHPIAHLPMYLKPSGIQTKSNSKIIWSHCDVTSCNGAILPVSLPCFKGKRRPAYQTGVSDCLGTWGLKVI